MEPVKMTRAEYEQKYGKAPVVSPVSSSSVSPTPIKMTRAQYEATYNKPVPGAPEKQDGFLKSLVKAPATMIARPFQAVAALGGVSDEAIDKFSKEKLGGFVAPTPDNFGEVKQDFGRGIQTAAFGMPGLASGGAAFGVGSSLEKGNDLFSADTAMEAGLSAAGAKVGGAILNPLFRGAGKFVPAAVKNKVGSAITKVSDAAGKVDILPAGQSSVINKFAEGAESVINKPFSMARNTFLPKSENLVSKTMGIGNSKGAKDFKRFNNGKSMEEYLVETGNINSPEKAMINEFEKATASRVSGEEAMKQVPGIHKNEYVEQAIKGLIEKEAKIGIPGGDSSEIVALANKYRKNGGLEFWEANRVKQLYEKNVKLDFLKERATDSIQRANRIDHGIRQWQRNTAKKGGFTNLSDIMKQTQNARMVANELYKKSLKGDASKGFSLFDAVLLSGGHPSGLAMAGARRLFSSDAVRTGIARALAPNKKVGMVRPKAGPIKDFFLNEPKAGTPKTTQGPITTKLKGGPTLFTSPKGKSSTIRQEAADVASVDLGKAKASKPGKNLNRQVKMKEALEGNQPFVDSKKLPVIKSGTKPKIGDTYKGKPVIELGSSNPKVNSPKPAEKYIADKDLPTIQFGKTKQGGFIDPKLAALGAAGTGAIAGGKKLTDMYKEAKEFKNTTFSTKKAEAETKKPDLKKAFLHTENRGAAAEGKDVYKVRGVTGDLGKYQVKPETLKDWSRGWLGKQYTPEEFLKSPEAQEEFMDQFLAIVEAYDLKPEEAAIVWHKGWGVLGDNKPREEKKKLLRKHIDSKKDEASEYVKTFMEGLGNV